MTSGLQNDEILQQSLKRGALDVIFKPFVPSVLHNCITRCLTEGYSTGDKFKYSVLIIDDQATSIAEIKSFLSPDYIVLSAETGSEGILAAQEHLPDVIVLYILMTDMDGYEVISALKISEKTKHIPVIFITTLSDGENEEKGLALGAADYISKPFSPAIVQLRIKNQISILEQIRINEHLSMYDQLTDLPNRRCFEIRIDAEWGRALREKIPISILIVDIDFFKNYNDTYGHQQGDVALQSVAKAFEAIIKRPGDLPARWGGEEFIVLLPNTDSNGAESTAEQLRAFIEEMEIPLPNESRAKITVSIGVNTEIPTIDSTKEKFISGADEALYSAKNRGRNRVCVYGD